VPETFELPAFLATEETLDTFVAEFQTGTLPAEAFKHVGHVTVAAYYCVTFDAPESLTRIRHDIRAFNEAKGNKNTEDSGYHETITVFWLDTIRRFVDERCSGMTLLETVGAAVMEFGGRRDLFRSFWSFDVLESREARVRYIAPDREG